MFTLQTAIQYKNTNEFKKNWPKVKPKAMYLKIVPEWEVYDFECLHSDGCLRIE